MNIMQKLIMKRFLFFFTIIFLSLEVFFVLIDFFQHLSSLPPSANLKVLYVFYNAIYALDIVLSLSLLFAFIATMATITKRNELMNFYSFGAEPIEVLRPIFLAVLAVIACVISINITPLTYAQVNKDKILDGTFFKERKTNVFLKNGEDFIFFKQLFPLRKEGRDIFIFKMSDNNDITQIIYSKRGFYKDSKWYFIQTTKIIKPANLTQASKMTVYKSDNSQGLANFEPNIIKNIEHSKTKVSIYDVLYTLVFFSSEDINQNTLMANLYNQTIVYFYVFPLMLIIFLFLNPSKRFCNIGIFVMVSIFLSIGVWGGYFLLQQLAVGDLLNSHVSIISPIVLLFLLYYYLKNKKLSQEA